MLSVCFLSELDQSVEQLKKEHQTLKEESQSREKELKAQLTQVGLQHAVSHSSTVSAILRYLYLT